MNERGEMILYQAEDGEVGMQVRFHEESLWLSINQMSELFGIDKSGISRHLKNIFESGELERERVVAIFATTAADGKEYQVEYHNLDAIISVGYRVQSLIATRFRIWATGRLREYIVKGFVMDDERLKNPPGPDMPDHFDEMLERIRDIRASEKRVYLRVREIFAMAADYIPNVQETKRFYSTIQNKLHFAVAGMTGPEIIKQRADHNKTDMGLTSHKHASIRKSDVTVAKNYLSESEIDELNRIVVMWLDFAEDQTKRRKQVFLNDWETRLDDFLRFNDREVLAGSGKVKKTSADASAVKEYEEFATERRWLKELEAEKDYLKQLESAAKALPSKSKK